jgi:hypothetical protein
MQSSRWTNPGEVVAYFFAQAIRLALVYALAQPVLLPFYKSLGTNAPMVTIAAFCVGAVALWLCFPLFLALRAGFGGVPAFVAPERRRAFATSVPEIGAYAVIVLIGLVLSRVVSAMVMTQLYMSLRAAGQMALLTPINIAIALFEQAILFVAFVVLRSVLSNLSQARS